MKIYIYIFSLLVTIASCSQTKSYEIQTNQEQTLLRVEIKDTYSQIPMYEISYPKDWEFHQVNDTNNIYISSSNGLIVEGETMSKAYMYSDNKSVLAALNFSSNTVEEILTVEDIIQNEIIPKFESEGFEWLKTYPLGLVSNNSFYFSNSTYRFPDEVKTYATEWINSCKGQKKLCLIQYIKDASAYTSHGYVTNFGYSAEILTMKESDFEPVKNAYIQSLESIEWNKAYVEKLFNQAFTASTVWKNQMVVRKDPLVSYLRSLEFHNRSNHFQFIEDQICMGAALPDSTLDSNGYYNPSIGYQTTDWDEISF